MRNRSMWDIQARLTPELVPDELPEKFYLKVIEVWNDLVKEYFDNASPTMTDRKHGSNKTYQQGCRGPHCRIASNQVTRKQRGLGISAESQIWEPIIEHFARSIDLIRTDAILNAKRDAMEATFVWAHEGDMRFKEA